MSATHADPPVQPIPTDSEDYEVNEPRRSYKVWLEIEEFDAEADTYRDLDTPGGAIAEFGTYGDAWAFVESVDRFMRNVPRSKKGRSPGRK